jgi:hypothetical protein
MRYVLGTIAGLLAIVACVVLAVGIWHLGWFVRKANVNQNYQVNVTSQEYQQSLVSQERDRLTGIQVADDPGQKKNLELTFCSVYANLTPVSVQTNQDLQIASTQYCTTTP